MPKTIPLLAAVLSAGLPLFVTSNWRAAPERSIEAELEEPTQFDFTDVPLTDVVDYLKSLHKIEIQVDGKALSDVGLDPAKTPITKNIKGISLRSALQLMLRDPDLTYTIKNESLLITTPEQAETELTTKIYAVGDLWGFFQLSSPGAIVRKGTGGMGMWCLS